MTDTPRPPGADAPSSACDPGDGYAEISPEQAHALLQSGGVSLLDVRTAAEFAYGHIEGALNCPSELLFTYRTLPFALDRSRTLLIYCRSGRRARDCAPLLLSLGFERVLNFGGVLGWKYGLIQSAAPGDPPHPS